MQKSIYTRIFYFCTIVLIFFCALSGLIVTIFGNWKYRNEAIEEYDQTALVLEQRIKDLIYTAEKYTSGYCEPPYDKIETELQEYTSVRNIDCYLFENDEKPKVRTDYNYMSITLSDYMRKQAQKDGTYCEFGSGFGTFSGSAAMHVSYFEARNKNYYLLMIIQTENLSEFSGQMIGVLIATVLLLTLIAAPLLYLNTAQLLKPIVNITHAAESYAKGDFSARLEATGGDSELDYLAETMNRMADFIDKNEQSRRSFVSNVSHELKTPMTTIGGFVDGILDGTIPPEQEKQYLRTVSSEVQRMSRLVHSMLNISKFEEGSLEPSYASVDMTHLLIKTLLLFEKKVDAKHVSVVGLEDCPRTIVECDSDLMQQVFYNLTENAIKFIDDGGTLSVRVKSDAKQAHVHLRNTGDGLTEKEISHVFERFYKTDASRGKDTTGVGLGLSIVSRIVRLHGGTIAVKSVPKSYTEFVVNIPMTQAIRAEEERYLEEQKKRKNKRFK